MNEWNAFFWEAALETEVNNINWELIFGNTTFYVWIYKNVILKKKENSYMKILKYNFVWANLGYIQLYKPIKCD